ncbi:BrnA antitoxin family protein [Gluconobacter albidus]|uniref:BrnA antitoxin family protein n=1 Tax=Gluconobacter albidus TaxID=318683 RepID=UPI00209F2CE5|nr:BrnA antitoxin family protein [Gluconobacter albidus]MCP1275044.1 BrnA antitoxin family protein [Gluconobacter albidus]
MSRKTNIIMPTDEEDARINQGIALDSDNPELTEADFLAMRLAAEATPALAKARRVRGPQKAATKRSVSLRLDQDVLEKFKSTGPGWQTRINEALRRA